jgi:hypothetical protein
LSLTRGFGNLGRHPNAASSFGLQHRKKCWTADRLARHGMSHPDKCSLCNQEEETIDHLLVTCVFARQFWLTILRQLNLQDISPQPDDRSLEWWRRSNLINGGAARRGLNSIIILGLGSYGSIEIGVSLVLSKRFCDTSIGATTGAARFGSFVGEGFGLLIVGYGRTWWTPRRGSGRRSVTPYVHGRMELYCSSLALPV